MDVREALPSDIRALSGMSRRLPPGFPSEDTLLRTRQRMDVLMPVAVVEGEITGFALAVLVTEPGHRSGTIRYLLAFADRGPLADAIRMALLSQLERWSAGFEIDTIQLNADQPPTSIAHLEKVGYRPATPAQGSFILPGAERWLAKCLRPPAVIRAHPTVRDRTA